MRPVRISVLLVAFFVSGTCGSGCCPTNGGGSSTTPYGYGYQPSMPWGGIDVWTTMLVRRPRNVESEAGYAQRLENNANLMRTQFASLGRFWTFYALNETYYDGRVDNHHDPENIPCRRIGGFQLPTVECYDAHIRDSSTRSDPKNNTGSVAFLANQDRVEIVGPVREHFLAPYTFLGIGNALSYPLTGARFRLMRYDHPQLIVPLYSVKLPTSESSGNNRMSQLNDMIGMIRDHWWAPGDLTPVVVGDMNFTHSTSQANGESANLAKEMRKWFFEAGMVVGGETIEAIWVGKEEAFPGARGTMAVVERDVLTDFDDIADYEDPDDPGIVSDHPAVHGRLEARTWDATVILNSGLAIARSTDGPALAGIGDALYLAFSEDAPERRVRLAAASTTDPSVFSSPWSPSRPATSDPIGSHYSPALARFEGRWVVAWVGKGHNKVNVMSRDSIRPSAGSWSHHRRFEQYSDDHPVLLAAGDRIWLAWKEQGSSRMGFATSSDGQTWSEPSFIDIQTAFAPALAHYQDRVFVASTAGGNGQISIRSSADRGTTWSTPVDVTQAYSHTAPSLLGVHASELLSYLPGRVDSLYLTWAGKIDRKLRVMTSPDGRDWGHVKRVLEHGSGFNPSLLYLGSRFLLAWTDDAQNGFVGLKVTPVGIDVSIDKIY